MLRYLAIYVFLAIAFLACQPKPQLPEDIVTLEKQVQAEPTNVIVTQLLDLFTKWLNEHPEKSPMRKVVLEKQLKLSTEHLRYPYSLSALQGLLIDYNDDAETPDRLLQIGQILEQTNKTVAAQALHQSFVQKYPTHPKTAEINAKYPTTVPIDTFIQRIGESIFSDTTRAINENAAREYVDACEAYALVYHGTDAAAEYLHKASQTAASLRSNAKALALYDWLLRAYPNHERAAQALFLKAFAYDNNLHDIENARKLYTEFIQKYPNDKLAGDAQFLLENLGKSDDELLKALQEKAAQNQDTIQ